MKKYRPRKGGGNAGIFAAGFSLFPAMGIVAIAQVGMQHEMTVPAIISIIFGLAVITYILLRNAALGFLYGLDKDYIYLKRNRLTRDIAVSDIAAAGLLDDPDLQIFMTKLAAPIAESKMQLNLKKWWQNSKIYGDIVKWVSVVITETETRAGGPLSITSYKLNLNGRVAAIKLKNGELLLITPLKIDRFIEELTGFGIAGLTPRECIDSIPRPDLSSPPEKEAAEGRRRRIILIIIGLFIIAAALLWTFIFNTEEAFPPEQEQSGEEPGSPAPAAELLTVGMWEDDQSFLFLIRADHPEALDRTQLAAGEHAPQRIIALAARQMIKEYLIENPEIKERPDAEELENTLRFTADTRLIERKMADYGVEIHIYRVYSDELRTDFEESLK